MSTLPLAGRKGQIRLGHLLDVAVIGVAAFIAVVILSGRRDDRILVHPDDWREMTAGHRALGRERAELVVVEFLDYLCPGCVSAEAVLSALEHEQPNRIRRIVRHLPLVRIHPGADTAAFAAECAAQEGKFHVMHAALFEHNELVQRRDWKQLALIAGVAEQPFLECLRAGSVAEKVAQDVALARRLGVTGTPAIFLERELLRESGVPTALRIRLRD